MRGEQKVLPVPEAGFSPKSRRGKARRGKQTGAAARGRNAPHSWVFANRLRGAPSRPGTEGRRGAAGGLGRAWASAERGPRGPGPPGRRGAGSLAGAVGPGRGGGAEGTPGRAKGCGGTGLTAAGRRSAAQARPPGDRQPESPGRAQPRYLVAVEPHQLLHPPVRRGEDVHLVREGRHRRGLSLRSFSSRGRRLSIDTLAEGQRRRAPLRMRPPRRRARPGRPAGRDARARGPPPCGPPSHVTRGARRPPPPPCRPVRAGSGSPAGAELLPVVARLRNTRCQRRVMSCGDRCRGRVALGGACPGLPRAALHPLRSAGVRGPRGSGALGAACGPGTWRPDAESTSLQTPR